MLSKERIDIGFFRLYQKMHCPRRRMIDFEA